MLPTANSVHALPMRTGPAELDACAILSETMPLAPAVEMSTLSVLYTRAPPHRGLVVKVAVGEGAGGGDDDRVGG